MPIRALEGDNCNRVVELIYQSEKLASNDSRTKVYFEGFLRRIGKDEDQTDGEFCEPATDRETLSIKIVIENNNEIGCFHHTNQRKKWKIQRYKKRKHHEKWRKILCLQWHHFQ